MVLLWAPPCPAWWGAGGGGLAAGTTSAQFLFMGRVVVLFGPGMNL